MNPRIAGLYAITPDLADTGELLHRVRAALAGGVRVLQYRNTNRLIDKDDWNIGLQKTGYISEAGRCLVMQVNMAGRQLIMVFLDAAGKAARLGDAEKVRHWLESSSDRIGENRNRG